MNNGWTRINRNILECKDNSTSAITIFFFVLIETYWNVKIFAMRSPVAAAYVLIETYWNVKSGVLSISRLPVNVLIETYWNVKAQKNLIFLSVLVVLIETYWNVKTNTGNCQRSSTTY